MLFLLLNHSQEKFAWERGQCDRLEFNVYCMILDFLLSSKAAGCSGVVSIYIS